MDISNIPNELYKEIIDKDGQRIIFDFKDLVKSKKRICQTHTGRVWQTERMCSKKEKG